MLVDKMYSYWLVCVLMSSMILIKKFDNILFKFNLQIKPSSLNLWYCKAGQQQPR